MINFLSNIVNQFQNYRELPNIHFKCIPFVELSLQELYEILALRQQVFIVEQNCPFLDADGIDQKGWHLLGFDDSQNLVAYTRLLPVGTPYEGYTSIGRVVTSPNARKHGFGKILMSESINRTFQLFDNQPIKIGAQKYLEQFYESFGFKKVGDDYLEDEIWHTKMILHLSK
jgi:ElaA protein